MLKDVWWELANFRTLQKLKSLDDKQRAAAAETLLKTPESYRARQALLTLINDNCELVRVAVARSLIGAGFSSVEYNLPTLLKDESTVVRLAAINVLNTCEAVGRLEQILDPVLNDSDPDVRTAAARESEIYKQRVKEAQRLYEVEKAKLEREIIATRWSEADGNLVRLVSEKYGRSKDSESQHKFEQAKRVVVFGTDGDRKALLQQVCRHHWHFVSATDGYRGFEYCRICHANR